MMSAAEVFEFSAVELDSIVSYNGSWKAKMKDDVSDDEVDYFLCRDRG